MTDAQRNIDLQPFQPLILFWFSVDSGKQRRYATKILPGLSAVELNVSEHNVVFVLLRIAASCGEFGEMTGFIPPETV